MASSIPLRRFGKSDVQISALGLGGHHLGAAKDEQTAVEIVHQAIDGGVTFFDCCWEYNRGKSEDWLGKGVRGHRKDVFLMTKVCTHGRDGSLAEQMLEQSLRRLQTDYLDLWQVHGVGFQNDPDLFIRPGGAAEALTRAKRGKVKFVGFTGHKDPEVHLAMLRTGFPFDAVQMPLNPFDANFFSFEQKVLPELQKGGDGRAGHEADWRPWRAGAAGDFYSTGAVALCDVAAGDDDDYGRLRPRHSETESRGGAGLYDRCRRRRWMRCGSARSLTRAMGTSSATRRRSNSTIPRRGWRTTSRSTWHRWRSSR